MVSLAWIDVHILHRLRHRNAIPRRQLQRRSYLLRTHRWSLLGFSADHSTSRVRGLSIAARQWLMYGRASFPLLRQKMLHCS